MNQIDISITILTALLTSGILMLFIENQHVADLVHQQYLAKMKPFIHKLSNYFNYVNLANPLWLKTDSTNKATVNRFTTKIDTFRSYAYEITRCGQDYPVDYFSAQEMENICEEINNVWYEWEQHKTLLPKNLKNEYDVAQNGAMAYLQEVFPKKDYSDLGIIEQIANVSSDFYNEVYAPIKHLPKRFENWKKMDKDLKYTVIANIVLVSIALVFILLFRNINCDCIITICTVFGLLLLIAALFLMIKIESFSRKMFL